MTTGLKVVPVLFVLPTLGTGGSERVVLNLCLNMNTKQFRTVVAAFHDGGLRKELTRKGISVHVLKKHRGIDFSLILKLRKLILANRIRVINSHHFVSLFYAFWAARWACIPIVHTEHSRWEMQELPSFWDRWFKFFLRRINFVSVVSQAAYNYLKNKNYVNVENLGLVTNGVDFKLFRKARNNLVPRSSIGLNDDHIVIATVGNLRKEKNQALLIEALARIKNSGNSMRVVIVGDGPYRNELQALAKQLGVEEKVILLGTRNDVPNLFGNFDMYCLTSRYEGLPLTLLEAMASGVPVIGTDVLGIREVIRDQENGILVPDNDPEVLAKAILELSRNPRKRRIFVENGFKLISTRYNFEAFIKKYEQLFKRVALGVED